MKTHIRSVFVAFAVAFLAACGGKGCMASEPTDSLGCPSSSGDTAKGDVPPDLGAGSDSSSGGGVDTSSTGG